ncbi:MAG: sulfatase [Planctomycetota bacterium]
MDQPIDRRTAAATVGQGARAGLVVGVGLGLSVGLLRLLGVDGSLFLLQVEAHGLRDALARGLPAAGALPGLLGCVLAAGALYGLAAAGLGGALAVAARALGARRAARCTPRVIASLLLGLGLGLELYWWTRPVVLPGLPATDPKRLVAASAIVLVGLGLGALVVRLAARRVSMSRSVRVGAPAIVLAGGAFLALDTRGSSDLGRLSERNRDLPNVLVVVVDALRRDTLGCYGDERVHTPHIDRLAREGALFERALVHTPFTWPSFGSLLTGKLPRRHGLMKMAPGHSLPDNETLPTLLKGGTRVDGVSLEGEDFVAGAFMTGTLSHGSGLLRGFDAYFEALVGHDLVDVHSRWSRFRSGLLPWLLANKVRQKLDRQLVVSEAERWLRRNADRRFMALVHLYSTHTPYDPPADFRERHLDPSYNGPFPAFYASHREAIEQGLYTPNEADIAQIRGLYLAGVEQADTDIGRLLGTLEALGTLDDTIVVVTSDHGESLGEHGLWEHNWMYQDNLLIPLVLRWPGGGAAVPAGVRVPERVELSDVLPTLLGLMGVEAPPAAAALEADGATRDDPRLVHALDGDDLRPLMRGARGATRPYAFAENGTFLAVQDDRWKLIVRRELLGAGAWERMLRAAPEARTTPALRWPELFDLDADPLELQNVFEREPTRATALFRALVAQVDRMPIRDEMVQKSARDVADEALFRALGYGGGVGD